MDIAPAAGLAAAGGYLLGSVPFSYLAVKVRTGTDLRRVGSGNVGATNATRVLGRRWFPALFLLDAAKGAGAVLAAGPLAPAGPDADWARVAAAVGAVLGHVYCLFLGFRGGKAVATGAGTVAVLSPWALAAGVAVFVAFALAFRFISLGSMAAAVAATLGHRLLPPGGDPRPQADAVTAYLILLTLLVLWKHRDNIRRIAAGTEPRIFGSPPAVGPGEKGDAP